MYTSHEAVDAILSFNMAVCKLTKEDDKLTIVRQEKLYMHKARPTLHFIHCACAVYCSTVQHKACPPARSFCTVVLYMPSR